MGVPLAAPALKLGLPGRLRSEESTCDAGDTGSIPGSGECPGEVGGNPLQYAFLKTPQGSLVGYIVHGVTKQLDMDLVTKPTNTKIGRIQRKLAWPLHKDDTQICEAFHIFFLQWNMTQP